MDCTHCPPVAVKHFSTLHERQALRGKVRLLQQVATGLTALLTDEGMSNARTLPTDRFAK